MINVCFVIVEVSIARLNFVIVEHRGFEALLPEELLRQQVRGYLSVTCGAISPTRRGLDYHALIRARVSIVEFAAAIERKVG